MQSVTLKVSHLKAALVCAATKDIRYYLNAVLLEVRKRDTLLVSTDGHRLSVIHAATVAQDEPDNVPAQIIIPREVLKGLKSENRRDDTCTLQHDPAKPESECRISGIVGGDRVFVPIDAKFPDYTRVIPATVNGERAVFDPALLAEFLDVVRIISGNSRAFYHLHENSDSSAIIQCAEAPEFLGVVMPMRWGAEEYKRPEWLDEKRDEEQAIAA